VRQAPCGLIEARERIEYAREQMLLAEVAEPWPTVSERKASGAAAVLAAIAASDALCCMRLGARSRDSDHRAAVALIGTIEPDGKVLARKLNMVLDAKDPMHYSSEFMSAERHRTVMRAARHLLQSAEDYLRRT
jgi:hypothetical protein